MTELYCDELLFDSEICNWKMDTSTFDKHLFNKENIVLMIEDNENNLFGLFIESKLNSIRYETNGSWKGRNQSLPRISHSRMFFF